MKILIEFGHLPPATCPAAVWIADTPESRPWFEALAGRVDANSASLKEDAAPLTIIRHVFEHHPAWTEIVVQGEALTGESENGVVGAAFAVKAGPEKFSLLPSPPCGRPK